jgi:hypothetical protein
MKIETGIVSPKTTVIRIMKGMVPTPTETGAETGNIIGDDIPTNDLTALKAQDAIANDTDVVNLLDLILTPLSSFLRGLTRRGAGRMMIQQRTS